MPHRLLHTTQGPICHITVGGGLHIAICNTPLLAPPDIPLYKKSYILLYYPKN